MNKRQRKKNCKNGTRQPNILKMLTTKINKTMEGKIAALFGCGITMPECDDFKGSLRGPAFIGVDYGRIEQSILAHQRMPIIPIEPM